MGNVGWYGTLVAVVSVSALSSSCVLASNAKAKMAEQVDTIMTAAFPPDEPGAAVLVAMDGEVIFRKGYGLANVEHEVRATPDSVFRIYSMTKQFTGVCILILAEQGKLSLDDDITKFLRAYPTHGKRITIAHLLGHQSGIHEYNNVPKIRDGCREDMTVDQLIDLFKDKPPDFEPGSQLAYSNSGYIVLSAIIERVSGKTYAEFVDNHIFKPAGMRRSLYDEHRRIIPNRAAGYTRDGDRWVNARFISMTESQGAGGLASTVNDMFLWDQALRDGKLFRPESLKRAFTPFELNDGTVTDYACGWGLSELHGRKVAVHGGGFFGFSSYAMTMPHGRIYVVLLTNCPGRAPGLSNLAAQLAAVVLGQPYRKRASIRLAPDQLDRFVGEYTTPNDADSGVGGATRSIRREGDQLFLTQGKITLQLEPISANEFYVPQRFPTRLVFSKDGHGEITEFVLDWPLGPPQTCVKLR